MSYQCKEMVKINFLRNADDLVTLSVLNTQVSFIMLYDLELIECIRFHFHP